MPKAEVGSTKYLGNKLKSKGLQRLRWYCQVCEKQCRDANGFKMHTMSESHVRQMLVVGEDPKKFINEFSNQFLSDFLSQLKTAHGEKQVHINHFYQEYIANKEHIHMNSTKWPSLTELAKHLGREGICRVEETDKGLHISWIDNSPEALRRQEALRKKAAQNQGDEELEQQIIQAQIRRAKANAAETRATTTTEDDTSKSELKLKDGERLLLSFGAKKEDSKNAEPLDQTKKDGDSPSTASKDTPSEEVASVPTSQNDSVSFKLTAKPQVKNIFAQAKKNALAGGSKKTNAFQQPKKMSEAERIMKQELERKRSHDSHGSNNQFTKRQRSN